MTTPSHQRGLLLLMLIWGQAQALEPDQIYEQASPAVVIVRGLDAEERPLSVASGIVTASGKVVTNCSTLARAKRIQVMQGKLSFEARLEFPDVERDLCQLEVKNLIAPPVAVGSAQGLRVGQRVYAIAAAGADVSITDGVISSFRDAGEGSRMMEITARLSKGSGAGGLFDANGRMVGVIASQLRATQNHAVPVEWIREVPERGKVALARRQSASQVAPQGAAAFPRQLVGEELVAHLRNAGNVELQSPSDILSLAFRMGNRFEMRVWNRNRPGGESVPGTYEVRTDQNLVCLNANWHFPRADTSYWPPDCYRVSQTGEKTYSMTSPKTDYTINYAVR